MKLIYNDPNKLLVIKTLTDTSEDSKLVNFRAMSMTQRRLENTRVHFGANSLVSVKSAE